MEEKLRVLLVIGKSQSFRMLDLFEPLSDIWDLSIATFLQDLRKPSYFTQIPIKTFIEDSHMPGYMRGLEEEISKADMIVCAGFADHTAIQTLRSCRAHQKPLVAYLGDAECLKNTHLLDDFTRQDILTFACAFISCDAEAAEYLTFLGVDENRILSLSPRIAHRRLGFQPQLRAKFRKYIQVADGDCLILCADPLENFSRTTGLLMAIKFLVQKYPEEGAILRVIFTGTGAAKEQLKYLAVDAGIAKHVIFISQDTAPFLRDLYSAADLGVSLSSRQKSPGQEPSSFWVLEGLACGLRPLLDKLHPLAGALHEDFSVATDDFEALALGIQSALLQRHSDTETYSRRAMSDLCRYQFDAADCREVLLRFFEQSLQTQVPQAQALSRDFADMMAKIRADGGRIPFSELLPRIDLALEMWERNPEYKAQLQLFKAQAHLKQGDIEAALNCFELCTADESVQREAYLGLGRIAAATSSFDEAMSFYRKALAIKPNDPDAMAGLGFVYRKSAMPDDAVYWLAKSVSVDSGNGSVLLALTQACLESEDITAAIEALEQLQISVGDKAPLVMALGQLYYKQGDFQKGRLMVDQAMAISEQGTAEGAWKIAPSSVS